MPSSASPSNRPSFPTRRSSDLTGRQKTYTPVIRFSVERIIPELLHESLEAVYDQFLSVEEDLDMRTDCSDLINPTDEHRIVVVIRSEEHTSELQSLRHLVCRLLPARATDPLSLHDALPI